MQKFTTFVVSFTVLLVPSLIHAQTETLELNLSRGSLRSILTPLEDIHLSTQVEGVIQSYPRKEGEYVKAREPIVQLDARVEQAEVARAQAALNGARAEYEQAKSDFERIEKLFKDKITSQKQYDEAKYRYVAAESHIKQAEASVDLAHAHLSYRTIRSPIDGLFFKKTKSVGESVTRLEPVARIIDDSLLRMVLYASPDLFGRFHVGDAVQVQLMDGPAAGDFIPATVHAVDTLVDPASGTFRIQLHISPADNVAPGLAAVLIVEEEVLEIEVDVAS